MNTETLLAENIEAKRLKHSLVMVVSIVLAVVASELLSEGRFGLDFILLSIISLAAMVFMREFNFVPLTRIEYGYLTVGFLLTLCLVFRYSEVLYRLNLLGIFTIICLAFVQRYSGTISDVPVVVWLRTPFSLMRLLFLSVVKLISIGLVPSWLSARDHWHIRSIALGLLWASPILYVFGSLLVSADSRFESFAMNLFSFDFPNMAKDLLSVLFYLPFMAAFLYATVLGYEIKQKQTKESSRRIEGVQMLTILISINVLFFSYIVIQFGYFFGGDKAIIGASDLTYSTYARRGFWELVWIAMIVLPLLLVGHWLQRNEPPKLQVWLNRLAFMLVCAIVIIEISAAHRMYLYIKIYGLTELRFYSSAFMLYIIGGLIAFYFTVLRGKRGRYVAAMAGQAVALILLLNMVNPDSWIARHNLTNSFNESVDNTYLSELSADAYPMIYTLRELVTDDVACLMYSKMNQNLPSNNQWFQWNLSLNNAHQIMNNWDHQCY